MEKARFETHNNNSLPLTFYHQIITTSHDRTNWHENVEILLSVSGKGQTIYNADTIEFNPGDIMIINPYNSHTVVSDSQTEVDCFIIDNKFCIANGLNIADFRFKKKIQSEELTQLLKKLASVYQSDNTYKNTYISGLVLQIAAYISEHYSVNTPKSFTDNDHSIRKDTINKAMMYISANLNEKITLDEICQFLNINKSYFTREFKYFTHMTFVNYINILKCNYAKTLLRDDRNSITAISEKCGFDNVHYFSTVFKKHVGTSPMNYKKHLQ